MTMNDSLSSLVFVERKQHRFLLLSTWVGRVFSVSSTEFGAEFSHVDTLLKQQESIASLAYYRRKRMLAMASSVDMGPVTSSTERDNDVTSDSASDMFVNVISGVKVSLARVSFSRGKLQLEPADPPRHPHAQEQCGLTCFRFNAVGTRLVCVGKRHSRSVLCMY